LILKAVNAGNESGGVPIAKRSLSSLFSVLVRDAWARRKETLDPLGNSPGDQSCQTICYRALMG
jgi:hypothetical protein